MNAKAQGPNSKPKVKNVTFTDKECKLRASTVDKSLDRIFGESYHMSRYERSKKWL